MSARPTDEQVQELHQMLATLANTEHFDYVPELVFFEAAALLPAIWTPLIVDLEFVTGENPNDAAVLHVLTRQGWLRLAWMRPSATGPAREIAACLEPWPNNLGLEVEATTVSGAGRSIAAKSVIFTAGDAELLRLPTRALHTDRLAYLRTAAEIVAARGAVSQTTL